VVVPDDDAWDPSLVTASVVEGDLDGRADGVLLDEAGRHV